MRTSRLSKLLAAALFTGVVASCDDPTRPPVEASIEPRIQLIQADAATRASLVLPLTEVRVRTFGPTGRVVPLTLEGGVWRGTITGLEAGDYELVIEGIANGQVQYYGRLPNITVARGQRAQPTVQFAPAVPVVTNPPLQNTTNFSQRIPFAAIPSATSYVVQVSQDNNFVNGVTEFTAADTNPLVNVTQPGTWFIRSRAILPQVPASSIPWSEVRSWVVVEADGGDNPSDGTAVPLVPEAPQTVGDRNLTPTKREDWYDIALQQGDSLIAETFAARLLLPSNLNTTLTLFRNDGTTEVAQNLDATGTTDSRLVHVAANSETFKLRVGASSNTSGHYELRSEIRRLPLAPNALVATIVSGTAVSLVWADNANNETSYRIERCAGAGCTDFTEVGTTAPNVSSSSQTSLTQGTTYLWRVRARNNVGNSGYSNSVTTALVSPAAPTNFAATTLSNTSIRLTWTDASSNETGFEIQRCTVGTGCTFSPLTSLPADVAEYVDATAEYNTSYQYQVRATNNVVPSAFSPAAAANTVPPSTPTGLAATVAGPTTINLSWSDASSDETHFLIERCQGIACSTFVQIDSVAAGVTAYASTVATNAAYRFRIRARNAVISQSYSDIAGAATFPPAAPTGLAAVTLSNTSIRLTWTDAASNETAYEIWRCTEPGCVFAPLTQVSANTAQFVDASATYNTSYQYQVRALNAVAPSAFTAAASAGTVPPATPTGLTAQVTGPTTINLTWTDASTDETAFLIERCAGDGCTNFVQVDSLAAGVSTYTSNVASNTTYRFRIRARNAVVSESYSATVEAGTFPPAAPTNLAAVTLSNTSVQLTWTDVANNETVYEVERCVAGSCTFATLVTLSANVAQYLDASATYNTSYQYRVRAVNSVTPSAYSAAVDANTVPPATPTGLTATVAGPTTINLSWTDASSDETHFLVERCTGAACVNFAQIDSVGAGVTAYASTVAFNTAYRFRIRARNAVISETYTATVGADTRPPTTPASLTATTQSGTSIALAWTDAADNETGYLVERCSSGLTCTDFTTLTTTAANATAFADNSAVVNQRYRYRVTALGVAGNSAASNIAAANTLRPAAPSDLVAAVITANVIRLTWTDNANNETGYSLTRCSGAACGVFTVVKTFASGVTTVDDSTSVAGVEYTYQLSATNVAGSSAASNSAGANTLAPGVPTGLAATLVSATQVDLAWVPGGGDPTGVRVERCTGVGCSDGDFAEIAFVPTGSNAYSDLSTSVGNFYRYRIRAQNAADVSAYTAQVTATTEQAAAPTGLTLSTVSATQIDLSWVVSAGPGVVGHLVERCDGPSCNAGFVVIDSLDAAATSYQNTGLSQSDFGYRIRAVNTVGRGSPSATVSGNTRSPAAPTGLTATVLNGLVRLAWTDNADNELGVVIERCDGAGCSPVDFATRSTVDFVTWDDSSVVASTEYAYSVRTYNNAAGSASSNAVTANTLIADQVTVLSATAVSTTQIDLSWTPSASQGTGLILGYNVYRCDGACDPATGTLLAALASSAVLYADASVTAASEYTYMVVPFTAFGETPRAGSATAFSSTALPAAPSGFTGTLLSPTSIRLDWTDNASNETNFEVAQCSGLGCTTFATVATLGADVVTFLADTLTSAVRYRFIVRSVNTAGSSPWSDTVSIATTVPALPTGLTAFVTDGSGNVRLQWTDASTDEDRFHIDFCSGAGCTSWAQYDTSTVNTTQYDAGSVGAATVRFRVRAVNGAGSSAPSAFVQITGDGPYAAPTGTIATTTGPTSIRVTWSDQTDNETVFRIFRCAGGACDPVADGTEVGTVPRDSTVFDDTGVPTGALYRYAVLASNGFGELASASFDGNTRGPDAPTVLTATTLSDSEIALAWTDGGDFETGYVIERCAGGGCTGFTVRDTVAANFVSFNDTGLTPNATYRYRVQAINAVAVSAYSNIAEKTTDIPATPSALSALAMTGTRIDLAWTDNATNEEFYIVERCAGVCDGAGTFAEIETNLAPGAQAYADNTVSAGQTYSYRVRAVNSGGASAATNIATAITTAPIDPTDLAVSTLSGTLIQLSWTDNATNELSYRVERCAIATCPTFTQVRTLAANTTAYVDTVAVDDEYTYRVRAVNNVGPSGYTLDATANTIRPAGASDFVVTTVSGTRIDLTWTDNATNEDGYVLERCSGVACSSFALLDSLPPDANGFQNDGIAPQTSFTYRLYAYNIAGGSALSGPLTATTITPAGPTGLASVLAAPGQIDLNWTDNANNESQYRVERCNLGTTRCATADSMAVYAIEVATLPPDATSYSDGGLASSTLYFYRVRATNTAGTSAYSPIVSRSTSVPPAPTGLTALTVLATRVNLAWTDASSNETGFRIERCVGADPCTGFTEVAQVASNTNTFVDNTVTAAPVVSYRVVSFNGGGGTASGVVIVSTVVPAAPSDLEAAANGQTTVNLTWADNASDEAGFYIERCTGPDCTGFVALDTLAANAVAFADLTVTAGNIYRYRLRAFGNGNSDYAPIADVATVLPNPVTGLVATAFSDTRVDLSWSDNTPTDSLWNEVAFRIYRCAGDGCTPSVLHATVPRDNAVFTDSPLTPGETFVYQVQAVNFAGVAAPSNPATAATTVPSIPTSLSDSTVSATEVLLQWTDNANNETGYEIERCEGSSCTDFAPVDTAAADAQSRVVGGLVGTTVYRFRIRAFNAGGSTGYSNVVVVQSDVPPAPTTLTGVNVSSTQVNLAWADNSENETAYIIERCSGSAPCTFALLDSVASNTTSFQDATIAIDTVYQYRVRASNGAGPSGYTGEVSVSTYRPATPTSLVATPVSATRVDLTWTDVAVNDTVIIVQRCLGGGCSNFDDIDSLPPDATSFSDLTVTVNNTYNYRLRAENAAGASLPSASASAGTFIPSDPSGLTATVNSATQITLNWTDNSNTEVDFLVERCEGDPCGAFGSPVSVAANAVTYQDATVTAGNVYGYRVTARAGGGNSVPSNVATVNTLPAGDVASVTATPLSATTVRLTWTATTNLSGYQIRNVVSPSDTAVFASVSSGVTDTVVTVPTGIVYNFVVRAVNPAGAGAYAGTFVAMTPPPAPVLSAFPLTADQVSLAWTDTTTRETGFEVERGFFSAGSFSAYTTVATPGANVTSGVNSVSAPNGRYRYRVRAINAVGAGAYSNVVDLTLTGPAAPSGLSVAVTAPGQITLTWTDNSNSEQSFSIERSVGSNLSFAQVATVSPGAQSHVDSSGISINTAYYYRVRAVNNIGASGYSNEALVETNVPVAVAGVSNVIQSSSSIQLSWNGAPTTGELGFRVYRCVGGGCTDFTLLDGSVPADAITYTDVAATYGVVHRYQVRPYNLAGEPTSNLITSSVLVLPTPDLTVLPVGRTSLRPLVRNSPIFTWETGFEIEQCAGFSCTNFAPLATLAANDSMTVSGGLTANGEWYRYRVRAVASGNLGPWSAVRTANTPRVVTLGDNSVTATTLEVNSNSNMVNYVVAMPAGSPTVEFSIGENPAGTTTNGGSYLLVSRGKGIERFPSQLIPTAAIGDTLCSARDVLNAGITFITAGNNGGCTLSNPGVTTDYYVTTYSLQYTNLRLTVLPGPTTYAFNNCTQTGREGPTQGLCDAAYTGTALQGQVTVSGPGLQDFAVPFSGRWQVTATGAAGVSGDPARLGGRGAQIAGEFVLSAGQNLRLAVGQMGIGAGSNANGGGGGGSFVYDLTGATPLLIAGGGGGTRGVVDQNGCDASVTVFGTVASGAATTTPCTVKNTDAGLGGIVSSETWGSAGAGFNSNGADDLAFGSGGTGGFAWAAFLLGGLDSGACGTGNGGFGGGGSGAGCNGGGGGGGYSGGDGGRVAGGGGSFNGGTNASATAGVGTGHGSIILKYLGPVTP